MYFKRLCDEASVMSFQCAKVWRHKTLICPIEHIKSGEAWYLRAFQWNDNFTQRCETFANSACCGLNEEIRLDI